MVAGMGINIYQRSTRQSAASETIQQSEVDAARKAWFDALQTARLDGARVETLRQVVAMMTEQLQQSETALALSQSVSDAYEKTYFAVCERMYRERRLVLTVTSDE